MPVFNAAHPRLSASIGDVDVVQILGTLARPGRPTSRQCVVLAAALMVAGLAACSKGPSLPSSDRDMTDYSAFPGTSTAAKESTEPLKVTLSRPTDRVAETSVVAVGFNRAMVGASLGVKTADRPPFDIKPAIDGQFRWMGSRTAVFHPTEKFAAATRYEITVPAGTTSLDGAALDHDYHAQFHTPFLVVDSTKSEPDRTLRPSGRIEVTFNLPVALDRVQRAVTLRRDGQVVAAVVTENTDDDEHRDDGQSRDDQTADPDEAKHREFSIRQQDGFDHADKYTLIIDGSLTPVGGDEDLLAGLSWAISRARRHTFREYLQRRVVDGNYHQDFGAYGEFDVEQTQCGYTNGCYRTNGWSVSFSNPVNPDTAQACVSAPPGIKFNRVWAYGSRIRINPTGVRADHTYKVGLTDQCADKLGNHLAHSTSVSFAVDHDRPHLDVDTGLHILERGDQPEPPKLPVTLENTGPARLRMYDVPAGQLAAMSLNVYGLDQPDQQPLGGKLTRAATRSIGDDLERDTPTVYSVGPGQAWGGANKTTKSPTRTTYYDIYVPTFDDPYHDGIRSGLAVVTDLGITAKHVGGQTLVWVTRLSTGQPVEGAKITTWSADGRAQWSGNTDADGLASAPYMRSEADDGATQLVQASKDHDTTIIDLHDYDGRVNMFGLGLGYGTHPGALAAKNFIYTERGVYRAGETVHIKGYTRLERDSQLLLMPADTMIVAVENSRGKHVARREVELSDLGGFSADVDLPDDAALGTYRIKVSPLDPDVDGPLDAGDEGHFRVEAYRTPQFEVLVEPEADQILVGHQAEATLRGRYLFGAPMADAKVKWRVQRSHTSFESPDFPEYRFSGANGHHWYLDASRSRQLTAESATLDDRGELAATFEVPKNKDFRGPQTVQIEASVTDVDRQTLSGEANIQVHPGQYYVGVNQPDYLVDADQPVSPTAVAVDYDGRAVGGKPVKLELIRREWTSVKKKSAGGGFTWVTDVQTTPVEACTFKSESGPSGCAFDLPGPGSYRVRASSTDELGNHLVSTTDFYGYGDGHYGWGQDDDEIIDLVADADTYEVGDTAHIMVQSPFEQAKALVTVERASVLDQFTTDIDQSTGMVEIPITDTMKPNAYVSVALVRGRVDVDPSNTSDADTDDPDPGRPAFKIGYAQLNVDHSDKHLAVDIEPDSQVYRPGGRVHVDATVKDDTGQPAAGELTFMAVDQGVLSLTGYETPTPESFFYADRPLQTTTVDTRLMLTTRAELEQARNAAGMKAAAAGDGGGQAMNYRAKFATTAAFESTVEVGADGHATVDFDLPDSLTAYRLMAVAVSDQNRFGSAHTRIKVNKPLMARPALPRFGSTGDTFEARVVVQSLADYDGQVTVDAHIDGPLELTGASKKVVSLEAGAAKEVAFPVEAGSPGEATVRFSVHGHGQGASDKVEATLPIEYPAAEQHVVASGQLAHDPDATQSERTWRLALPEGIRSDVGGLTVELSSSAVGQLLPGLDYLVDYPYGCVEQITGRTLPMVAIRETVSQLKLPGLRDRNIAQYIQGGIGQISAMQTRDGGLGYWPNSSRSNPWASAYGALALVRAKQDGRYDIATDTYDDLMDYLSDMLRGKTDGLSVWDDSDDPEKQWRPYQAFAAWVLAEADQPEPSYHTRLFDRRADLPAFGKAMLAMAIATTGVSQRMQVTLMDELTEQVVQESDGTAHLKRPNHADAPRWRRWYWSSAQRDDALMLMALLQTEPNDPLVAKFARGLLVHRRHGRWSNTQATAFAVLALGNYFAQTEAMLPDYQAVVGLGETEFDRQQFTKAEIRPRRVFIPMEKLAKFDGKPLSIARRGSGGPLYYTAKLSYAKDDPPKTGFDGGFHVSRTYVAADGDRAGEPIETVRPGQVVKVRLAVSVPEESNYVAIEDPLPAGFEPVNTSFKTTSTTLADTLNRARDASFHWWAFYGWMSFDYTEQHDDKVVMFANHLDPGVYRHAYLARATTPGEFTAAAARVEAMYEPLIFGRSDAARVTIK